MKELESGRVVRLDSMLRGKGYASSKIELDCKLSGNLCELLAVSVSQSLSLWVLFPNVWHHCVDAIPEQEEGYVVQVYGYVCQVLNCAPFRTLCKMISYVCMCACVFHCIRSLIGISSFFVMIC